MNMLAISSMQSKDRSVLPTRHEDELWHRMRSNHAKVAIHLRDARSRVMDKRGGLEAHTFNLLLPLARTRCLMKIKHCTIEVLGLYKSCPVQILSCPSAGQLQSVRRSD
jgi:hypothetical protein